MRANEILFESSDDKTRKLVVNKETYNSVRIGNTYNFKGSKIYIASKDGAHPSDPTGRTMLLTVVDLDDTPESQETIRKKQEEQRAKYIENVKIQRMKNIEAAEQNLKNGFETESSRKEALNDLNRAYEDLVRNETTNEDVPFNLSQIREKHFGMFKGEPLTFLKKLLNLRNEIKEATLVPKKRDLEKAEKQRAAKESVIAVATRPLKEEAMEKTEEKAKNFANEIKSELEKVDFNPYKIVPKVPDIEGRYSAIPRAEREEHRKKQQAADQQRSVYLQFLKRLNAYNFEWDQESVDHYINFNISQTAAHYDSFVAKMNAKIPNAASAKFRWLHDVWGHSELIVDTPEGQEVWKTQVIINYSKLGKVFNQWPSRRVK